MESRYSETGPRYGFPRILRTFKVRRHSCTGEVYHHDIRNSQIISIVMGLKRWLLRSPTALPKDLGSIPQHPLVDLNLLKSATNQVTISGPFSRINTTI